MAMNATTVGGVICSGSLARAPISKEGAFADDAAIIMEQSARTELQF